MFAIKPILWISTLYLKPVIRGACICGNISSSVLKYTDTPSNLNCVMVYAIGLSQGQDIRSLTKTEMRAQKSLDALKNLILHTTFVYV